LRQIHASGWCGLTIGDSREFIVSFASSGYVALFEIEIEKRNTVTLLALRRPWEEDDR
jgi:hypothetical protein